MSRRNLPGWVLNPTPPYILLAEGSDADVYQYGWDLEQAGEGDVAVRQLRGQKMRTLSSMFDETSAALQFPDYFGENWYALYDCAADLEWMPASGYVLIIRRAESLLRDAPDGSLCTFLRQMIAAGERLSTQISEGTAFDRPPRAFHLLLHAEVGDELRARLELCGSEIAYDEIEARPDWRIEEEKARQDGSAAIPDAGTTTGTHDDDDEGDGPR